jgi:hypothetical protein
MNLIVLTVLVVFVAFTFASPVKKREYEGEELNDDNDSKEEEESPKPYHYKYEAKDEEKQLFFKKEESGDEKGKGFIKISSLNSENLFTNSSFQF